MTLLFGFVFIMFSAFDTVSADSSKTIYVNDSGGNDNWDGQSAEWTIGTLSGPKKSIKNATWAVYDGGTVNIADGLYTGENNTNILIDKNIIIKGQSRDGTIINGTDSAQIFTVQSGANITVQNLTFADSTGSRGSAFYNKGTLIINNCSFIGNTADQEGGAIYNTHNLVISDCIFTGNKANDGGAVYIYSSGNLIVNNSTFTDNTATTNGGAIYILNGALNIGNSTFLGNRAGYGGAIYNGDTLTLTNVTFTNNNAGVSGGAVVSNTNLIVNNSIFTGNHAGWYGGAIWNSGDLKLTNGTFTGTTAGHGGTIYNYYGNSVINGTNFTGNNVDYYGGAVYNLHGISNITNSNISGNTATSVGAAFYNEEGTMNVHFCQIVGNLIAGNARDIYNSSGSVNVEYNWWGSNDGPSAERIYGVTVSKWLVLTINAGHAIVKADGLSTITADLLHDNGGNYINPNSGHVPDGITVNFNTNLGTIGSLSSLFNGIAQSILNGGLISGVANVSATVNSQTVNTLVTIDAVPPTVISIDPVNKAKIKAVNKEIKIIFSEPIQAGSAYNSISVTGPSGAISITKSISGNVLTLTPTSSYVDGLYNVNIPTGAVTDLAGNDLAATFDSTFTVDTIAPTVNSNDPSNNAKIKVTNKAITITFSEPIQAGSAYDSISVTRSSGAVLIIKSISGNVLTLTPISNYIEGIYSVNIPVDGVTDLTGNALTVSFASGFTVDATKPTVGANSTGGLFNTSQSVLLTATDNLDPNPVIYYTTDGTNWYQFTGSGTVLINNEGKTNLEFYAVDAAGNPSEHITYSYTIDKTAPGVTASKISGISNKSIDVILSSESNAKIYYRINSGSWHTFTGTGKVSISSAGTNKLEFYAVDVAGNPSAHKICSYTIDKTAPKVAATSPKNGAAGVSRTATISIRLSENILKSSNWSKIYIKNLKTGAKCKITAWVSGNRLYIKTSSKRAAYTWYQVYIPASAIKDSAGNNLAATYAFKFKTGKY